MAEKSGKRKFRLRRTEFTYRKRLVVIIIGFAIGATSLWMTNRMAHSLRQKEQYEIALWSMAMERLGFSQHDPLMMYITNKSNIPFIIIDARRGLNVQRYHLIPEKIISRPDLLHAEIEKLSAINQPLQVTNYHDGSTLLIFYGESTLLKMLLYFPFIQLLVIAVFAIFGFITFRSSRDNEQNRIWIGLAKETAHQLGTPTSSLLGWIEYLKNQPVDQAAVTEMENDLTQLMKIVDRFSKIGSETILSPGNVNEIVGNSVLYFKSRVPRNVRLEYNGLATAPVKAMVNGALFEWVVENLLKNALDALQGKGEIKANISSNHDWVNLDVFDTGKGISKANFKRIFEPGFTTKTRGWGLGLSLSKRIIEEYHKGKIWVVDSEPGKGTTIRIALKKIYV